uniref:THAP-type domain-containing protein n=1 Tax=Mola mola TaxID=94237 RepID=A0A3Q3WNW4_MOLML
MSFCGIQRKRLSSQRGTDAAVKCSVPLCSGSSRLNSKVSFHSFPVDPEVRARWLTKIGRDSLTPTENTRVCSRHFRPEDFVVTAGGQRGLKMSNKRDTGHMVFKLSSRRESRERARIRKETLRV